MKIGLLHEAILPPKNYGGIERIVLTLAKEYRSRGHEVVVFCRVGSAVTDYETILLPKGFDGDVTSYLPGDLDFLHSHQPLSVRPPLPFLVTIHGNGHIKEKYFSNTNFLSQSHARNHYAKYYVYNGVDPTHYPFVEKKNDHFAFLARTTWRVKNLKTAIQWANDLKVNLKVMGGQGRSTSNIEFLGLVDEKEKLTVLSSSRALIYPTNWDEPCAAAPLEALACGTPVLSSANGCMPELIKDGTGIVCNDYEEMVDAIHDLDKLRPMDARQRVENFFSLKRMTDDYLALIQKIMEGDLDQLPKYNFTSSSVNYIYKKTFLNRTRRFLTGKI